MDGDSAPRDLESHSGDKAGEPQSLVVLEEVQILRDKNFIQDVSQFFNQHEISDVILKVSDMTSSSRSVI
jgi:hypothetical protein